VLASVAGNPPQVFIAKTLPQKGKSGTNGGMFLTIGYYAWGGVGGRFKDVKVAGAEQSVGIAHDH
jgi:hypothetical protein